MPASHIKLQLFMYLLIIMMMASVDSKNLTYDTAVSYWRRHKCVFPPSDVYAPDEELLAPCKEDALHPPCDTFLKVSTQLCMALGNHTGDDFKNIVDESKQMEKILCNLTQNQDSNSNVRSLATYMNSSSHCEAICTGPKRKICTVLVAALCKFTNSDFCNGEMDSHTDSAENDQQTGQTTNQEDENGDKGKMASHTDGAKNDQQTGQTTKQEDKNGDKVVVKNEQATEGNKATTQPKPAGVAENNTRENRKTTSKLVTSGTQEGGTSQPTAADTSDATAKPSEKTPTVILNKTATVLESSAKPSTAVRNKEDSKTSTTASVEGTTPTEATVGTDQDDDDNNPLSQDGSTHTDSAENGKQTGQTTNEKQKSGQTNKQIDGKELNNIAAYPKSEKGEIGQNKADNNVGDDADKKSQDIADNNDNDDADKKSQDIADNNDDDDADKKGQDKADNNGNDEADKKGQDKNKMNNKDVSDDESYGSGHFLGYFLTAVVICVAGYIIFHNKQKIMAFVIEGRSAHQRRQRSKGVKYAELKSNVEEVMPSLEKTAMAKNFIY